MSGHEAARRELAADFPGWTIQVHQKDQAGLSWSATRPLTPGRGGVLRLHGDTPALLRELLTEADHGDARLALRDLATGLQKRGIHGVTVRGYHTNIIINIPGQGERLIVCERGNFRWSMGGRTIGPLSDVPGALEHIADALTPGPP